MAVYSVLLAEGQTAGVGEVVVYTASALNTVVVRDVVLVQSGSGGGLMAVSTVSGSARGYIYQTLTPVRGETYHWEGRQVLQPGEDLRVNDDGTALYYRISGYLLGGA